MRLEERAPRLRAQQPYGACDSPRDAAEGQLLDDSMMHSARQHCANSLVAAAALADAFPGAGAADRVSWRRLPHPRGARSVCLPHAVRHQLEPRRGGVWPRRWQLAARWAAPRRTSHQVRGWCGRGRGFIGGCVGGCGGGGCGVTWWLWLMLCGVVCMCVCQMMVPCIHTPSASPMCTYPAPDPAAVAPSVY